MGWKWCCVHVVCKICTCSSHFSFNHRPSSVFEPNFPAIMSSLMTPVVTPAVLSPQVVTSSATVAPQAPAPPSKRPTHTVAGLAATAALAAVGRRSTRRSGFAGCATVTGLKTMKRLLADPRSSCVQASPSQKVENFPWRWWVVALRGRVQLMH